MPNKKKAGRPRKRVTIPIEHIGIIGAAVRMLPESLRTAPNKEYRRIVKLLDQLTPNAHYREIIQTVIINGSGALSRHGRK